MGLFDTTGYVTNGQAIPTSYGNQQQYNQDNLPPTPGVASQLQGQQPQYVQPQAEYVSEPEVTAIPEIVERDGIPIPTPTAQEMPAFQEWLAQNKVTEPFHPKQHYDYTSAFRLGINRDETGHLPDTFKLPGHETFSIQSKYYKPGMKAGKWDEAGNFIPWSESLGDKIVTAPIRAAKGLYYGLRSGVPSLIGRSLEYTGIAPQTGKAMVKSAEEAELAGTTPIERDSAIYQGASFIAPSVIPGAPFAMGATRLAKAAQLAGEAIPTAAKALGIVSHAAPISLFGLSTAQETKEKAEAAGVDPGTAPLKTGAWMSVGMAVTNAILMKMLGPLGAKTVSAGEAKLASEKVSQGLAKGVAPTEEELKALMKFKTGQEMLFDHVTKFLPASLATQAIVAYQNANIEKEQGIRPDAKPVDEAIGTIAPTFAMNVMMGPAASAAAYVKGKKSLAQAKADFAEYAKLARETEATRLQEERAKNLEGKEVFEGVTGELKAEPLNFTVSEQEALKTMGEKEGVLAASEQAKITSAAYPDNTNVGDVLYDQNQQKFVVDKVTADSIIATPQRNIDIAGPKLEALKQTLPEAQRDQAGKAYDYILTQVLGKKMPEANIRARAEDIAPDLSRQQIGELYKIASGERVKTVTDTTGVFEGGMLNHGKVKPRAGAVRGSLTTEHLKDKGIANSAQLINAIHKAQLKGMNVSGMLNLLKDKESADALVARLNKKEVADEGPKMEKTEESLQERLTNAAADFIRINRGPQRNIKDTGETRLERFNYERAHGDTEVALAGELARLKEKYPNNTYEIVARPPNMEGEPSPGFQIARRVKKFAEEVVRETGRPDADIKAEAIRKLMLSLRDAAKDKTDVQLKAMAEDIYKTALTKANATPKEQLTKMYESRGFGPAIGLAEAAKDKALTSNALYKELKTLGRNWWTKFLKEKNEANRINVEKYNKLAQEIQDPDFAKYIFIAKLDPAVLRDFIAGKSAVKVEAQAKAKEQKVAAEKKAAKGAPSEYVIYLGSLRTNLSRHLTKIGKMKAGTKLQGNKPQALMDAAKRMGATEADVKKISKNASSYAKRKAAEKPEAAVVEKTVVEKKQVAPKVEKKEVKGKKKEPVKDEVVIIEDYSEPTPVDLGVYEVDAEGNIISTEAAPTEAKIKKNKTGLKGTEAELKLKADETHAKGSLQDKGFVTERFVDKGELKYAAIKPELDAKGRVVVPVDLGREEINNAEKYRLAAERFAAKHFHPDTETKAYGKLLEVVVDKQGNIILQFDKTGKGEEVKYAGVKEEPARTGKLTAKPRVTEKKAKKQPSTMKQDKTSTKGTSKPLSKKELITEKQKLKDEIDKLKAKSKKVESTAAEEKKIPVPKTVKGRADVSPEDKLRIVKEVLPDHDAAKFMSENAQLANGVFRSEKEFKLALDVASKSWLREAKVGESKRMVVGRQTEQGKRQDAEKLMKIMLGFVDSAGKPRASLTPQEKADLKRETDKFMNMTPNRARTMMEKALKAGLPQSEMDMLLDLITDQSTRVVDAADLKGDTRGGQFDPFRMSATELDNDGVKCSVLATVGRRIFNTDPSMTYKLWKTKVKDYLTDAWDTVKAFSKYVWNRITQIPSPYREEPYTQTGTRYSTMFRELNGREIFYKFDEEIKKHINEAGNDITKRAIKNFNTRLSIRTDTRAPSEPNKLFELAVEFSRNFKNSRGDRAIPITEAEINKMRGYLDHQSILYNETMKGSIARKLVDELKPQFKGTPEHRKLKADELVLKMLSPYMISDKTHDAIVKSMKERGETRFELGDNWMLALTERGKPYYMRRVTDTVRNAVFGNAKAEVLGARMNGDIAYKYSNGIHTVKGKFGEFISLDRDNVFTQQANKTLLQNLELLDNARHGYKLGALAELYGRPVALKLEKGGVESRTGDWYIDSIMNNDDKPKITKEYIESRLPGTNVRFVGTDREGGNTYHVELPNGFKFYFNQKQSSISRIEREGKPAIESRTLGLWKVNDFTDSLLGVARDVDRETALRTFDHEILHMAVDTVLTKGQQSDLYALFRKPEDVNTIDTWEHVARAFATDAGFRRNNPIATKLADALVSTAHYALGLFGRYVEPAKLRDHLFKEIASGKIFNEPLLQNQAQFQAREMKAVIVGGKKYDPNIDAKNTWLEEYKGKAVYSILKETTARDSENTFFHNPHTFMWIKDLLKSYKDRDYYNIKGKVVSRIEHWLSNPAFLALARDWKPDETGKMKMEPKYKAWHDSVRGVQAWDTQKAADVHKYKLEKTKTFQTMKPHESRMFDPLAEWSNVNKAYLTEEQLRNESFMRGLYAVHNPEIKTGKLPEATIKGYLEISKFLKDEMLPELRKLAEESLLKPYSLAGVLSGAEYGQLATLYRDLLHKKETPDLKKILKDNPNVAKAYKSIKGKLSELRRIRNEMDYGLEGFFPIRRNQGPYYVAVLRWTKNPKYDPNKPGSKKEIRDVLHSYSAANAGMTRRIEEHILSEVAKDPAFKNTDTERYQVVAGRAHKLEDSSFFLVGDMNTQMIIDQALSDMVAKQKLDVDVAGKISHQILESIADTMRSRGAASTAIARTFIKWEKSPIIKGYIKDDMRKITNGYVAGVYGLKHKLDASILAAKIVKEIPDDAPQLKQDISNYWKENLRNLDQYDMLIGKAKAIAFNMYLLGKVSFSVMQITQNFVTGIPVLAAEMKQMGFKKGMLGAERIYTKAMFDIGQHAIKKKNFTTDEQRLLDNMEALGITLPQTAQDLGIEAAAFGDSVRLRIMKALAWPVAATETFNRKAAALAMYRTLKGVNEKSTKPMTEAEIYEKVSHYIDKTHYWMGRGNLPAFARGEGGMGKAGNLFYTFGRFWHNYALSLFYGFQHYGKAGGAAMAARSFAWLAALGGTAAIPFVDELQEIYEKASGKPIRKYAKKAMQANFGQPAGKLYEAGMLGFMVGDMSAAIRPLRMPFMNNASESLLGVYYGLGTKLARGFDAMTQGDYIKMVTAFSPAMTENIGKAYMAHTRGFRNAQNRVVYDAKGKPLKITPTEAVLMGMGFKPYEAGQVAEDRRVFDNIKRAWQGKRENIMEKARLAKTNSEKQSVANAITKYNMSIPKELRGIIPPARLTPDMPDKKWLMFNR